MADRKSETCTSSSSGKPPSASVPQPTTLKPPLVVVSSLAGFQPLVKKVSVLPNPAPKGLTLRIQDENSTVMNLFVDELIKRPHVAHASMHNSDIDHRAIDFTMVATANAPRSPRSELLSAADSLIDDLEQWIHVIDSLPPMSSIPSSDTTTKRKSIL